MDLNAQDIHFSQIESSPLNYNPAKAGDFNGTYRFVMNHKRQWNSFTNAYRTFSGSFDSKYAVPHQPMNIGGGLLVNSDIAGDGNMGLVSFQIPISVHYEIEHLSTKLSFGLMAGYNQYKVDVNKLSFGSDYDGSIYNPGINGGESIGGNQLSFMDFSTGMNLLYGDPYQTSVQLGVAYYHLNEPDVSFSGDYFNALPGKTIVYADFSWPLSRGSYLLPQIFYFSQGPYSEILVGAFYRLHPDNMYFHTLKTGFFYRGNDAVIFKLAFDYLDYQVGLSYDFNISNLNTVSKGYGGFEFSFIYIVPTKHEPLPFDKSYCPSFL
jgi:type IX secretion system PorP/SprF family membrane protein